MSNNREVLAKFFSGEIEKIKLKWWDEGVYISLDNNGELVFNDPKNSYCISSLWVCPKDWEEYKPSIDLRQFHNKYVEVRCRDGRTGYGYITVPFEDEDTATFIHRRCFNRRIYTLEGFIYNTEKSIFDIVNIRELQPIEIEEMYLGSCKL